MPDTDDRRLTDPATRVERRPAFPPAPSERLDAIVLVHGAWVGEWCWTPVLPLLRASGRPVHAVSLRGHGARRHESGPHITLADHVDDLVGLVEAYDLAEITLVAHSYGGRVVTRALPRLAGRVRRLVYLDAHAPLLDGAGTAGSTDATTDSTHDAGMVPFGEFEPDVVEFGDDAAVRWFRERVVAQSAATLRESLDALVDETIESIERTYVHATGDRSDRFRAYASAARADPDWRYHELAGSHWLMISHPDEVAAIILGPVTVTPDRTPDVNPDDPPDDTSARDRRENASCS